MKIEIVENIEYRTKNDNMYVREVSKGREIDMEKSEKTILVTPELFTKIFSPQRIKLMLKIKNTNINIYQLAKELNRKYEAVHRDIKLLEGIGIIKLRQKDKGKIPMLDPMTFPAFASS